MDSISKDPNAVLDYLRDWGPEVGATNDGSSTDDGWLQGDTISSSAWSFTGPDTLLVIAGDTNTTTAATVWLSGGTAGRSYTVTNRIVTAGGRTEDRSINVEVYER
jgi:hypothetical protein